MTDLKYALYSYNHGQGNMNEPLTEKLEARFTTFGKAVFYMKNSGICFKGLDMKPKEPSTGEEFYEPTRARGLGTLHFVLKPINEPLEQIPVDPEIIYYKEPKHE